MGHTKHDWYYSKKGKFYWCSRCARKVSKVLANLTGAIVLSAALDEITNRPIQEKEPPEPKAI